MTQSHARTLIRSMAGIAHTGARMPVVIVAGNDAPHVDGERWHYETRGGAWIDYPLAYARSGWSNMIYIRSSRRVVVGHDFLTSHYPQILAVLMTPERAWSLRSE